MSGPDAMGPKAVQFLTSGILIAGGVAMLFAGFTLGGSVALGVGLLAGLKMFGTRR